MRRIECWPVGRSHFLPTYGKLAATVLVALGRHNSIRLLNAGIIGEGSFTLSPPIGVDASVHAQQRINNPVVVRRSLPYTMSSWLEACTLKESSKYLAWCFWVGATIVC